jgi:hypothetical protein
MKMLAAALSVVTAMALVSGCAAYRYDRYGYGYGPGYYGYGYNNSSCWTDRYGVRQCVRS